MNEASKQAIHQFILQESRHQSIFHKMLQSIEKTFKAKTNGATSESVNQSINKSVNQSNNQNQSHNQATDSKKNMIADTALQLLF